MLLVAPNRHLPTRLRLSLPTRNSLILPQFAPLASIRLAPDLSRPPQMLALLRKSLLHGHLTPLIPIRLGPVLL